MGILKGLKTASMLDRLCSLLGLAVDTDAIRRQDPINKAIEEFESSVLDSANYAAEARAINFFREQQRAMKIESQYPGYREVLNRERERLGLPPL